MIGSTSQALSLLRATARTDGQVATASMATVGGSPVERDVSKLKDARQLLRDQFFAESQLGTVNLPSGPDEAAARASGTAPVSKTNSAEIARLKEKVAGYTKALNRLMALKPMPDAPHATLVVGFRNASGGVTLSISGQHVAGVYTRPDVPRPVEMHRWDPELADQVGIQAETVDSVYTGGGRDTVAITADRVDSVYTGNEGDAVVIVARQASSLYLDSEGSADTPYRPGNDALAVSANFIDNVYGGAGDDALALRGDVVQSVFGDEGQDAITITAGLVEQISGGDGDDALVVDAEVGGSVLNNLTYMDMIGDAKAGDPAVAATRWATMPADVDGGAGNDAISLRVGTALQARGGYGDDSFAIAGGGTAALIYGEGEGHDTVTLDRSSTAVVCIQGGKGRYEVEQGEDSLTIRMANGSAVTFLGLSTSGTIAVTSVGSTKEPTLLWEGRQTTLDRTA